MVRDNLSTPRANERVRGSLVSGVYRGEGGRARGMGVTPMTHRVTRTMCEKPYGHALSGRAVRKFTVREGDELVTTVYRAPGCGWKVD
jgi:hypothetical protein